MDNFEIPNPMDVATKFPELHTAMQTRINSEEFKDYQFKPYQAYDLARAALKNELILSWDQGLGKTRAGNCLDTAERHQEMPYNRSTGRPKPSSLECISRE